VGGIWQVIAVFEPSLGRVQVPVQVAELKSTTVRHTAELPMPATACATQPWRTSAGLVRCELNGLIYSQREGLTDGGYASFEGKQLVVLGNTVWFAEGTNLVHSTDTGTALRRDAQTATIGSPQDFGGFTSETTAIRSYEAFSASKVLRHDFIDGGLINTPLPLATSRSNTAFVQLLGPRCRVSTVARATGRLRPR